MSTFRFDGLEELERQLSELGSPKVANQICGEVIYVGAGVVADAVRESIDALPEVQPNQHGTTEAPLEGVTSAQKKGLLDGFGISSMRNTNGYFHVKLGFDGYNSIKTQDHPRGQPNALIARAVNSGTSFRKKTRFVDKAVKAAKTKAEQAMVKQFDESMKKRMK